MAGDHLVKLEDYEKYVGAETIRRLRKKVEPLRDMHVANVKRFA